MEQVASPSHPPISALHPLRAAYAARPTSDDGASRWSRLWASLIDAAVVMLVVAAAQLTLGMGARLLAPEKQPFPWSVLLVLGNFALWLALNGHFLASSAQTIGKRLMKIRVVNVKDGKPASLVRLAVWRALPMYLLSLVPHVGAPIALLGLLLIFRRGRRCLHDRIAGTRVVDLRA